jgi:Na+-translocating ferredoxin:NAD+ oxidoreductase RnfC subunit
MVMRNIWREAKITDVEEYKKAFKSAANCCDCGVCELFACPMKLSPCRVNRYIKKRLKEKGITVERNLKPEARESVDLIKIPTDRLVARLGLISYHGRHAQDCYNIEPEEVYLLFSQHIGMPALPVVQVGDRVQKGDLIAAANEKGLSANIHASVGGTITEITDLGVRIRRKED